MSKSPANYGHRQDGFFTERLSEALGDPLFADELVDWYMRVFNDQTEGEWAENWTPELARQKLLIDTAGQHDQTIINGWRDNGQLAGVMIGYLDRVDRVIHLTDLPPGFQTAKKLAELNSHLEWLMGTDALVVQYRELGIIRQHRQGTAVFRIFADAAKAAVDAGVRYGCWWTSRNSRVYQIDVGLGCHLAYDFHDPQQIVLMYTEGDQFLRRVTQSPGRMRQMMAARVANLEPQKP
ncbi:MAG: hypothetical protein ACK2UH_08610 [Candidatus Promineifilaceae bacterium]